MIYPSVPEEIHVLLAAARTSALCQEFETAHLVPGEINNTLYLFLCYM